MTLAELNALDDDDARRELMRCCGSGQWADRMTTRRPFRTLADLQHAANDVWWSLERGDWLEAFSRHPRIGERAIGWASQEQSGTFGAGRDTLDALIRGNEEYERRFGHVFLTFATGKSAEEMLTELTRRLTNDPALELRIAAAEQAKITHLRLEKLVEPSLQSSGT